MFPIFRLIRLRKLDAFDLHTQRYRMSPNFWLTGAQIALLFLYFNTEMHVRDAQPAGIFLFAYAMPAVGEYSSLFRLLTFSTLRM